MAGRTTCCRCLAWVRSKLPKLTNRMIKIYISCFIAMLSSAFSITMLFPFLPFMVEFLLPQLKGNEQATGNYVGSIASAMFLGRFFGSYIWGVIADHKGRKPVIIITLILLGLFSAAFGLSVHFAMAVVLRFCVGIANGMVGTVKAVISEMSDDSNQAFGISLISSAMGFGFILGPAISGAVSDPIGQYNLTIHNEAVKYFFTKFPYSLPCFVNLFLCILAAITVFFLLPETLGVKQNRRRSEILQSAALESLAKNATSADNDGSSDVSSIDSNDETRLLNHEEGEELNDLSTSNLFIPNMANEDFMDGGQKNKEEDHCSVAFGNQVVETDVDSGVENSLSENSLSAGLSGGGEDPPTDEEEEDKEEEEEEKGVVGVKRSLRRRIADVVIAKLKDIRLFLCSRKSGLALLIYCVFSFGVIGFDEIYSLWCYTPPHFGGLGFSLHEIGISLTISAVLFLPFSLFTFAFLDRKLGLINTFYLSVIINMVVVLLMPNLHYAATDQLNILMWILLCLFRFLLGLFITVSFGAAILFINNSVTFDKLGAVNGLAVSLTAITRCVSPILSGVIFSASLSETTRKIGFPFDYHLVFVIFSSVFLSTIFMAACLPKSINKQMIIEDVEHEEGEMEA